MDRQPSVPPNMGISVSHRKTKPPKDEPHSGLLTDRPASNVAPRTEPASVSFLTGANNFTIKHSTMNNAGRDVNIYGSVSHFSFAMLHYLH